MGEYWRGVGCLYIRKTKHKKQDVQKQPSKFIIIIIGVFFFSFLFFCFFQVGKS